MSYARADRPDDEPPAVKSLLDVAVLEAQVDVLLLHLELGDAVAQQPAGLVGPFVDGDRVTSAGELLGHREPCGA